MVQRVGESRKKKLEPNPKLFVLWKCSKRINCTTSAVTWVNKDRNLQWGIEKFVTGLEIQH